MHARPNTGRHARGRTRRGAARWPVAACVSLLLAAPGLAPRVRGEVRPLGAERETAIEVRHDAAANAYTLRAEGADTVVYTVDLDDADVASGMLRVSASLNGGSPVVVLASAGTRYRSAADAVLEPEAIAPSAGARLVDHGISDGVVVLAFEERPGVHALSKTYRLSLRGMSLVIEFRSPSTRGLDGYAGVSLGHAENAAGSRVVDLPYLPEPVALLPGGAVMTAYVDPTVSSSVTIGRTVGVLEDGTVFAHGHTRADPDTSGKALALSETAYVTVSGDLADVLPHAVGPASASRNALSRRLVLDDWGLHRSFSPREGVALSWRSPVSGDARLAMRYADANGACGDGVTIVVLDNGRVLSRLVVLNGQLDERTWSSDIGLSAGDAIRVEVDRAGNNGCDSTALKVDIDTPAGRFSSQDDFSSTQGYRGFSYLEYLGDTDKLMTWDTAAGRWTGEGAYSLFWRGGCHPGQGRTALLDAGSMVERYVEYGLTELAIIFHVWQRWGYDEGLPDHHPVNPSLGTGAEMAAFIAAARSAGMLVSLHENYTDMYPDHPPDYPSPLWDASAIALDRRGNRRLGWFQPNTKEQAFTIAADRMRSFAAIEEPAIAADYGPNAAYLDVTTGYRPDGAINLDAAAGSVRCLARATEEIIRLFHAMKAAYGGPLFGEGGGGPLRFDSYYAGYVDGVERQIDRRSRARVAPLYELLAVKPRMLNHGMGYYSRYFPDSGQESLPLEEIDVDQYRASEIAFGHAGFLGGSISGVRNWLRIHAPEYWLLQALQSRYADAAVDDIAYFDGERFRDTESALRSRLPLERARIRITYANGLVVYVNRDSPDRRTTSIGDFSYEQGRDGWGYFEDTGSGLAPMSWDPASGSWRGSRTYMLLHRFGGHPDGGAAVRTFTVPVSAALRIQGEAEDADESCGDGVTVKVTRNGDVLWERSLPDDSGSVRATFDLEAAAREGDRIALRIEPGESINCDSTLFTAAISWDDGKDHDWVVETPTGPRTLAPSGFLAGDAKGFHAYTARSGDGPQAPVVDYVASPGYHFARSRDGRLARIEEFLTDGGIAVVHGERGDDLHALALTRASFDGRLLLESTARGDINLRHLDAWSVLIQVRDLDGGVTADVTWGAMPASWRDAIRAGRGKLELLPAGAAGIPAGDPASVALDDGGNAVLAALVPGQSHLVRLVLRTVFLRGDANSDGEVDLSDGVMVLSRLFLGGPELDCLDAADSNDSGSLDLTDAIATFNFLFLGAAPPPAPGPDRCGPDPTEDMLDCSAYPACP